MTERILFLFSLVIVGFVLRKIRMFGPAGVMDLVRFNMDFLLPVLVFITAAERLTPEVAAVSKGIAGPLMGLPVAAAAVIGAGTVLGHLTAGLSGVRKASRPTYVYIIAFANAAFLPVPLSFALRGEDGVLFVSLYMLGYTPLLWSLGVWMLKGRTQAAYLVHPVLLGLIAGAALGLTGTALPRPVVGLLKLVGDSSIPLALIYSGAVLAEQRLSLGRDVRPLAWIALVKLVAVPAVAVLVLRLLAVPEPMGTQALLQAAMPCMAQAGLYVARFGGDTGLASKSALLTTALCVITVPFFLSLGG